MTTRCTDILSNCSDSSGGPCQEESERARTEEQHKGSHRRPNVDRRPREESSPQGREVPFHCGVEKLHCQAGILRGRSGLPGGSSLRRYCKKG